MQTACQPHNQLNWLFYRDALERCAEAGFGFIGLETISGAACFGQQL